jgi:hypothetical protein
VAAPDNVLTSEVKGSVKKRKYLWIGLVAVLLIAIIGLQLYFLGFKGGATGNAVVYVKDAPEPKPTEVVVSTTLGSIDKYELMSAIFNLEKIDTTQKLEFANLVNTVNTNIQKTKNEVLLSEWKSVSDCFGHEGEAKGLTDRVFGKGPLKDTHLILLELLTLKKAITDNDVITTSKSVSYVNEMVVKLNEPKVTDKWNGLLACDYKCDRYADLMIILTDNYLAKI